MSAILPIVSISEFTRRPNEILNNQDPFTVLMSSSEDRAVILKPAIFEKIKNSELWQEICEEWWELHDAITVDVVAKGKKMMKNGDYTNAKVFE